MNNNNKRVVLITGSPGRLGAAFCEKYYDQYFIVGVARNKKSNFAHYFIEADVRTQAQEIVEETLVKFKRIDVLINAAAITATKPLLQLDEDELMLLLSTNVVAPFNIAT